MGVTLLETSAPAVGNSGSILQDLPVFPGMTTGGKSSPVIFRQQRSVVEIKERFTRDLRPISMDLVDGQWAVRMHGFH